MMVSTMAPTRLRTMAETGRALTRVRSIRHPTTEGGAPPLGEDGAKRRSQDLTVARRIDSRQRPGPGSTRAYFGRNLLRMGPGLATRKESAQTPGGSVHVTRAAGQRCLGGAVSIEAAGEGRRSEFVDIAALIESEVRARGAALMGVVNTTPDSFFDGGRYTSDERARARFSAGRSAGETY